MNPSTNQLARMFGCTEAQVKAQFAANAAQLRTMADKAAASGKKVNGYTAEQLRTMADKAAAKSL